MPVPNPAFEQPLVYEAPPDDALQFVVQFRRSRRGFPEVMAEMMVGGPSAKAVLARLRTPHGMSSWPLRTDSVRVLDHRRRRLIDWMQPTADAVH